MFIHIYLEMWDHKLVFARYGFKLLSRLISHKDPKFAKKVLDEGCIDKFTKHLSDSDPSILTEIFNSFAHLIKSTKTPKPQIKFWVLNKEEIIKKYKIYEVNKFI